MIKWQPLWANKRKEIEPPRVMLHPPCASAGLVAGGGSGVMGTGLVTGLKALFLATWIMLGWNENTPGLPLGGTLLGVGGSDGDCGITGKIGTFRGPCVYCAIFMGILWCTLEPLRPMHTEMNTLWARTHSEQEHNPELKTVWLWFGDYAVVPDRVCGKIN